MMSKRKPVLGDNFGTVTLLLALSICLAIVGPAASSDEELQRDSLRVFTARLLLQIKSPSLLATINDPNASGYEIEETYDQSRELGKLVVYRNSNERVELYIRAQDNLYLEAHLGAGNTLLECKLTKGRPTDGYFKLFESIAELARLKSIDQVGNAHLIGPSSLLYLFREQLRREHSKSASSTSSSAYLNNSSQQIQRELDFRRQVKNNHRLIVDPTPIEFSHNSHENTKVVFKQTRLMVDRSPLLSELAAFVSLYLQDEHLFDADFLAIDPLRFQQQSSFDPFRLPAALACRGSLESSGGHLEALELDQEWPMRLAIHSKRLSAILHSPAENQHQVHLAFDLSRRLFNLRLLDRSDNVVDMQNQLIYHMPNEPTASAEIESDSLIEPMGQQQAANNKIRNQECSVLSGSEIFGSSFAPDTSDGEPIEGQELHLLSGWSFLVGKTNAIIYMGKLQYKGVGERLVHELEISYKYVSHLPAFFVMLAGGMLSSQENESHSVGGNIWLAKLWISAESCDDLHSKRSNCLSDLEFVAFRLDEIDPKTMDIKRSKEIQFTEFNWYQSSSNGDDNYDQLVAFDDEAFEVFNLRKCPLNKMMVTQEVVWNSTSVLTSEGQATDLDQFLSSQLIEYLDRQVIGDDLKLVDLRRQLHPGSKFAKYLIDIAELPGVAIQFRRTTMELVRRQQMRSNLVDGSSELRTLFECLIWASQFGNVRSVLFSAKGGCWLYESADELFESTPTNTNDHLFQLYDRHLESVRIAEGSNVAAALPSALEVFESKYLTLVNKEIGKWNRRVNLMKISLNPANLLLSGIQIGPLQIAPATSFLRETTLLAKTGYRFIANVQLDQGRATRNEAVLSRAMTECVSFASCMNRCKQELTCASFAYCHNPQSQHEFCQLSDLQPRQLQVDGRAQANLMERQAGCEIHSKNYLAYFEREMGTKSSHLQLEAGPSNRWWYQLVVGDKLSELDCAAACYLTQSSVTCLRFIYCPLELECFHWLVGDQRDTANRSAPTISSSSAQRCSTSKRKAISLYRLTLTTKSNQSVWSDKNHQVRRVVLSSLNTEQCADRCALDTQCESFDSCRDVAFVDEDAKSKEKVWRFECHLFGASIFNQADGMYLSNKSLDSSRNEVNNTTREQRHCDHYESLIATREMSDAKVKKIIDALRGDADIAGRRMSAQAVTQYFCASLIGLALGICVSGIVCLVARLVARYKLNYDR